MGCFGEEFKSNIQPLLKTQKDISEFWNVLDILIDKTFSTEDLDKTSILSHIDNSMPWKSVFSTELDSLDKLYYKTDSFRERLEKLSTSFSDKSKVIVNVPFKPSEEFISGLGAVFKDNGYADTLIDVVEDPALTGGAKLFYGGRYLDVTLENSITKLLGSKDALRELIQKEI